jgi:hypothetical protein
MRAVRDPYGAGEGYMFLVVRELVVRRLLL